MLAQLVSDSETTFILPTFVTLSGKPCGKLVPAAAAGQLENEGVGFAGYAAADLGQDPKDPDIVAIPDASSFTPIPFVRPGLALVHCDLYVEGKPWAFAPRAILKQALAAAPAHGLTVNVGAELEYFLVTRSPVGGITPADAHDTSQRPCYDVRPLTRMYDHLSEVARAMNDLGWGNYANDHEDGNGQFEHSFQYADALTTADRVITARYLLSAIAEKRGMTATFMPKPFADRTGSGLHMHLSLWNEQGSMFPEPADPQGLGLSDTAYAFIAGILRHARGLQGLIAPTVNSYKRIGPRTSSGSVTWAPRYVTYGGDDRTHYLRVPDGQRVELRGGDGSANPYLALAGAVAAGYDGISKRLQPGAAGARDRSTELLPRTLLDAMDALAADPVLTSTLDAVGPGVSDYFIAAKRDEFFSWHDAVSLWETERYLTAF